MYTFEEVYKRKPDSWRDWRSGMEHIDRMHAQQEYRMAIAARMGQSPEKDSFIEYANRMRIASGYTRS